MRKLGVIIVLLPVFLTGCFFWANSSEPVVVELNLDNHWRYLNINIVSLGQGQGVRLQIFPEIEGAQFDNTVITYRIYETVGPINRVLLLSPSGHGTTQACQVFIPTLLAINGVVTIY